ncbi:T6SS immunity protein Tdi1 domain-containing protein [Chitinophaga sp. Hz27]|uniref:T6SS immunity protein Tdi1 domain-containing protein n=1 Tax=Chitinophaga sp. Hz27 TaxID=3347169 RepID=UPI0035DAF4C1
MDAIKKFEQVHPQDKGKSIPAPADVMAKYKSTIPPLLAELWEQSGFCSYGKGFIWLVNPDDYTTSTSHLFKDYEKPVCIMKTGIGGVFFLSGDAVHYFDPVAVEVSKLGSFSLKNVFNIVLTNEDSLSEFYYLPVFQEAYPRLGFPAYDECYSFVPAIPLGGEISAALMQKVKVREYLLLLSQIG